MPSQLAVTPQRAERGRHLSPRPQSRDDVVSYIRELITSGNLRPQSRLSIEAVAADLNVSATPVREAFLELANSGWLRHERFRGFFVAELSRQDVLDAYFLNATLGGELTARAAMCCSAEELAQMAALDAEMRRLARERDPRAEQYGFAFHNAVFDSARSPRLRAYVDMARDVVPRRFWAEISGWFEMEEHGHGSILSALQNRDAATARDEMVAHIFHARDLLVAHLDSLGLWERANLSGESTSE